MMSTLSVGPLPATTPGNVDDWDAAVRELARVGRRLDALVTDANQSRIVDVRDDIDDCALAAELVESANAIRTTAGVAVLGRIVASIRRGLALVATVQAATVAEQSAAVLPPVIPAG